MGGKGLKLLKNRHVIFERSPKGPIPSNFGFVMKVKLLNQEICKLLTMLCEDVARHVRKLTELLNHPFY